MTLSGDAVGGTEVSEQVASLLPPLRVKLLDPPLHDSGPECLPSSRKLTVPVIGPDDGGGDTITAVNDTGPLAWTFFGLMISVVLVVSGEIVCWNVVALPL